jgi:uncharacterized protein
MRIRRPKILIWLLCLAAAGYLGAVALLYVFQRDLLYRPPQTFRTAPAAAGLPEAEEVVLSTQDGEKVIAWYVPPHEGKRVVVFFHGSGDTLSLRVPRFRAVIADGTGLIALSFRGYAGSSGHATERGLILDALAATTTPSLIMLRSASSFGDFRYAPDLQWHLPPNGGSAS